MDGLTDPSVVEIMTMVQTYGIEGTIALLVVGFGLRHLRKKSKDGN